MQPNFLSGTFQHFQTFVWLRWRIRINQLRHGSSIGKVLAAILLATIVMTALCLFIVGSVLGGFVPRLVPRENYFLFWDALVAAFCFVWTIYVATDIQRSDAITFDRILHLPVAFSQAFAVNYLSSLMNMPFICMCSFCIGFIVGSCFSIGPIALLIPIPFAVFLIAVTALTYQLQGWLAAIMSNPRRRQLVMIFVPLCIVVVSQIPAFVATRFAKFESERNQNRFTAPPLTETRPAPPEVFSPTPPQPDTDADSIEIGEVAPPAKDEMLLSPSEQMQADKPAETPAEEIEGQNLERRKQRDVDRASRVTRMLGIVQQANLYVPPLWMAGCVESMVAGTLHVFWLTGAMALVAVLSLRRNYRQTIRYYKGETDSRASALGAISSLNSGAKPPRVNVVGSKSTSRLRLVERRFPLVSEDTAAIITMTMQSMARAPEVKLYLLLPLIVPFVLFGVLQAWKLPNIDELKAAIIVGFTACSFFITSGMLGNYFAYDRAGFRAFVLSPVRRERILLGRNLATAPFLFLQTLLLALAIGIYFGMAIDKILGAVILSAAILPLYCLLTNVMSILTPFPLAAGSIQPKQFNLLPVLLSMALSMIMPAIAGVVLLPLGLEWLIDRYIPSLQFLPIAFLLSILFFAGSLGTYRWLLPWEGKLLANREKELLRVVTSKIE